MTPVDTYRTVARRTWRRLLRSRAVDETAGSEARSALVVAPHPDDETLGCGATIARRIAAGSDVWVLVAADGRHAQPGSSQIDAPGLAELRAAEAIAACNALGVPEDRILQLGIEDTAAEFSFDRLVGAIQELITTHEPDDIITTSERDWHVDHRTVSRATRTAASSVGRDTLLEYPIWWWIDGPWQHRPGHRRLGRALHLLAAPWESPFTARVVSLSTDGHLDQKRAAIAEYRTQVTNYTDEANWHVMGPELLELFFDDVELFLRIDRLDGVSR